MSDSNRERREGPFGPLTDEELTALERANERDNLFGAGPVNTRRLIEEVRKLRAALTREDAQACQRREALTPLIETLDKAAAAFREADNLLLWTECEGAVEFADELRAKLCPPSVPAMLTHEWLNTSYATEREALVTLLTGLVGPDLAELARDKLATMRRVEDDQWEQIESRIYGPECAPMVTVLAMQCPEPCDGCAKGNSNHNEDVLVIEERGPVLVRVYRRRAQKGDGR